MRFPITQTFLISKDPISLKWQVLKLSINFPFWNLPGSIWAKPGKLLQEPGWFSGPPNKGASAAAAVLLAQTVPSIKIGLNPAALKGGVNVAGPAAEKTFVVDPKKLTIPTGFIRKMKLPAVKPNLSGSKKTLSLLSQPKTILTVFTRPARPTKEQEINPSILTLMTNILPPPTVNLGPLKQFSLTRALIN